MGTGDGLGAIKPQENIIFAQYTHFGCNADCKNLENTYSDNQCISVTMVEVQNLNVYVHRPIYNGISIFKTLFKQYNTQTLV